MPPQTYFQYINEYSSYWELYKNGNFEINHLWFIENLYVISIVLIPLILFLKSEKSHRIIAWFENVSSYKIGFLLGALPLMIITILLKKQYPTGSSSLSNLSNTFLDSYFFISGILLASSQIFWGNLLKFRHFHFVMFAVSSLLFYSYYYLPNDYIASYLSISTRWAIWYSLCCLLGWCAVLTLLGYAQVYLNKTSLWLKKMNEAIYPFYILHQTVLVVFGYYIIQLNLNIPIKIILLFVSSFVIIAFIYRYLIYPFKIPRILFGMKKQTDEKQN
ncbi:acyltransferase family protein [Bizionia psychrotolerans]|uniref:acyltransferase family protein n=1 Tax=Bizionia psychrotolerans TaxID=1492901 RepID=UPI00065021B2